MPLMAASGRASEGTGFRCTGSGGALAALPTSSKTFLPAKATSIACGRFGKVAVYPPEGADVLPFMFSRLPADMQRHVLLSGQLGLGDRAVYAYHLNDKPAGDETEGLQTIPEMRKLENSPMLCISGTNESDSLCSQLDPHRVHLATFKGGHDAGGNFRQIAKAIMDTARLD